MPVKKMKIGPGEMEFSPDAQARPLSYEISLLTPMAGGGVKSWIPDRSVPIRSQSVKGNLRFWWRAVQEDTDDPDALRKAEKEVWGGTRRASNVRIGVNCHDGVKVKTLEQDDRGNPRFDTLPDYVFFPLQGQKEIPQFEVIEHAAFTLSIHCPEEFRDAVDLCVRLWVLFGGIGARTRRGCGSLYCREIMDAFQSPSDIGNFLKRFGGEPALCTAKWPRLAGAIFTCRTAPKQTDPINAWKGFLDRYKHFRQGVNCGRNPGQANTPGRTRWPEADALRRITNCVNGRHRPIHPAGNWFPRGAYGLPIQTEFRNEPTDPRGKFMLQPADNERWPSPAILKIIRLGNGELMETCLILNARMPQSLEIRLDSRYLHTLAPDEMPLAADGKAMPNPGPIESSQNPYDGLIDHLKLKTP